MARLLVLGNFEIALQISPAGDAESLIKEKEREILAFLRRLAAGAGGDVESLEVESFAYGEADSNPEGLTIDVMCAWCKRDGSSFVNRKTIMWEDDRGRRYEQPGEPVGGTDQGGAPGAVR